MFFKAWILSLVMLGLPLSSMAGEVNTDPEMQKMILYYVNAYRAKYHRPPLKMNSVISVEAAQHSREMANRAVSFGHTGFYGRLNRLYKRVGQCKSGAENVAYYRVDAKRLVEEWVASPGHRRNIMGNYNMTGIGIAHGKEGWAYYTQIFLRQEKETTAITTAHLARRHKQSLFFTL